MKKIAHTCDICHSISCEQIAQMKITMLYLEQGLKTGYSNADLCNKCVKRVNDFIGQLVAEGEKFIE